MASGFVTINLFIRHSLAMIGPELVADSSSRPSLIPMSSRLSATKSMPGNCIPDAFPLKISVTSVVFDFGITRATKRAVIFPAPRSELGSLHNN